MKTKTKTEIKLPLATWAGMVPMDRHTLSKRLAESGVTKSSSYKLCDVIRVLLSEESQARTRIAQATAQKLETLNKERSDDLFPRDEVVRFFTECFQPINQRLRALPGECATKCNPSDGEYARLALQQWTDESLPLIRSAILKIAGFKSEKQFNEVYAKQSQKT